jgi:6-phosphofructokinase
LASRLGLAAADAVGEVSDSAMAALVGEEVKLVPLEEVAGQVKAVPRELLRTGFCLV